MLNTMMENESKSFANISIPFKSSHQRCSMKKGVLRNFTKFTEKHLCQSLFFNKVAGLRPATLLKKRLWHRCFPVNFVKFLRTPFCRTPLDDCFYFLRISSQHTTLSTDYRSSPPEVFLGKGDVKICSKFKGEHPCQSAISVKLFCNVIEIALRHDYSMQGCLGYYDRSSSH